MAATSAEFKSWLDSNPQLKGTESYNKVVTAYNHTKNIESQNVERQVQYKREVKSDELRAAKKAHPTTIGEEASALGQAALAAGTGATTGALGGLIGTLGGIGEVALSGEYGTRAGAEKVAQAQTKGAQAGTIMPSSELGQKRTQQFMEMLAPLEAFPMITPELQAIGGLSGMMKPQVKAMAAGVGETIEGIPAMQAVKAGATKLKEKVAIKKATPIDSDLTPEESVVAETRRKRAAELPEPIDLTVGQATRKFGEQQFERETAKQPELGAPLRERFSQQNERLIHNLDAFIDSTGAEGASSIEAGQKVSGALGSMLDKQKTKVRLLYKEAEKAGEMDAPIATDGIIEYLNKTTPEAENSGALKVARAKAVKMGAAIEDESGNLIPQEVPLKTLSELRKSIGNSSSTPTDFYHAGQLKGIIDESMDTVGGTMLKEANKARKEMGDTFERVSIIRDITGYKKGTTDRKIAAENIFQKSILNNDVDSISKLRDTLLQGGSDGAQAWKELQGSTMRYIKDQALSNIARDEAGNVAVSAAKLDKIITNLDKNGKLELIAGKDMANQLRTVNDVAKDVLVSVPNAVNNSNTASILAAMFDAAVSGMQGLPLPIATALRETSKRIKDAKVRARVEKNLGTITKPKDQKQESQKNRF